MGAWGYGLFQSDNEYDTIEQINEEARKFANDPEFTFDFPEKHEEVVAKLNDGLFHQLLEKFKAKSWKHGIIYLAALSMQLGVKISEKDTRLLRDTLPRTKMYDQARHQMQKALDGYKNNGEGWNFPRPRLEDIIREDADLCFPHSPGYVVSQDLSKVPTSMPKEGEVEVDEDEGVEREGGEKTKGKVSTGKDALGDSAKLKAWLSS